MNTLTLVGRLVRDPILKESSGKDRTLFTIAVDRGSAEGTDFIPVTCFGPTAQAVANHTGKGHLVAVSGRLHSSSYEKDGQTIYALDITAQRVQFLARPKDSDSGPSADSADEEPF